jgi:hypothetical protein
MGLDFFAGLRLNDHLAIRITSCNRSKKETRARAKYKFKCHFHTYLQKQYLFIEEITNSYSKLSAITIQPERSGKCKKVNENNLKILPEIRRIPLPLLKMFEIQIINACTRII